MTVVVSREPAKVTWLTVAGLLILAAALVMMAARHVRWSMRDRTVP
jgi:hypothetical protein